MIEGIIIIIGLCITFIPILVYFNYLMNHVSKKTRFDYHLELVTDKKGKLGIIIAYVERILFGITISLFGIEMSEFFTNEIIFQIWRKVCSEQKNLRDLPPLDLPYKKYWKEFFSWDKKMKIHKTLIKVIWSELENCNYFLE